MNEATNEINHETVLNGHYLYALDQVTDVVFSWIPLSGLLSHEYGDNPYLIDHLIPEYGITCIAGKPKSGKSFIALQLAKHIAEGTPAFGRFETKQENVLLIAKEDHDRLLKSRLEMFRTPKELPIYFSTDQSVYMDTDRYLKTIISFCVERHITVLIADSFRRFLRGDENSSQDVSKLHSFFKKLNDASITVIFIHHHRKNGGANTDIIRGSSDIHAMVDSLLTITRKDIEHTIEISQDALRLDEPVEPFQVSIPSFEGQDSEYVFIRSSQHQVERTAVEQAMLDTLDYLSKQSETVHQAQIIEELITNRKADYKTGTIKNALAQLVKSGRITANTIGVRKYYRSSEHQSNSQTAIVPVRITE